MALVETATPSLTLLIVWPAFHVAYVQSGAPPLSNGDCDSAGIFLGTVAVTAILEKRKTPLDGVEIESDKLVRDQGRVGEFAAIDAEQLARVNLEAEFRFPFLFRKRAQDADTPVTANIVVS